MNSSSETLPRISIVTPTLNRAKYLEENICSVIDQKYPNVEHIIVDGGSTDGTVDMLSNYSEAISTHINEPDTGPYDAINKGFSISTGEILCWLNSDDLLLPDALHNVSNLFTNNTDVEWLTGLATTIDADGRIIKVSPQPRFHRTNFIFGIHRGLQQESTFFRRRLWSSTGASLDTTYSYASDYELWCRFFLTTRLEHMPVPLGAFRRHGDQITAISSNEYMSEMLRVRHKYKRKLTRMQALQGTIYSLWGRSKRFHSPNSDFYYRLGTKAFTRRKGL